MELAAVVQELKLKCQVADLDAVVETEGADILQGQETGQDRQDARDLDQDLADLIHVIEEAILVTDAKKDEIVSLL